MGNRVGYILSFMAGGLVGAIIAYKFAYDKAEEKADMEIEEMRQYFMNKGESDKGKRIEAEAAEKSRKSQNKPSVIELVNVKDTPDTQKVNYTTYSEEIPNEVETITEPVVLNSYEEFGEITHYSRVNLTFYDDLILADDSTMKTFKKNEVTAAIGRALDRFDKIGPDGRPVTEIWVRNDRTRTYYDIVKDEREYAVAAGMEDNDTDY